jgi:hypothetical protein
MTEKLNPEIKARWVAALRSGEYTQTTGMLKRAENTMCCLGVLCDLYDKNGWGELFDGRAGTPPMQVREWAGFPVAAYDAESRPTPNVTIDGESEALYNHNDSGRTFAEIADAIEAQL